MTPRKAAAGKTPRATNTTKKAAPASRPATKEDAPGDAQEWFVGPYGEMISRAEYVALMKRAGGASEEGEE